MPRLTHPLTGGVYELESEGRVRVEEGERVGWFDAQGVWQRGELRHADAQMIGWLAGARRAVAAAPGAKAAEPRHRARERGEAAQEESKHMDLGLTGQRALVTAASRGIGRAIAEALAAEGASVAICARSEGGLEEARKQLEGHGVEVFTAALDVGDGDRLRGFVAEAAEALGGLDIAICNASGGAGMGEEAWQANFDVDLLGATRVVEAATPLLEASETGSVVFISSTAALEFLGVAQPYNAIKAALIAHANDLSQSLAPRGIRVNTVSPGPIYFEGGSWEMIKHAMPEMYERALGSCALGRMGTPEEVARAVVFLASPAASLITGANLVADAGFTKRVSY
ncbi:MAG: SDR family oxidoreductase [Myxococcota bacterium]